MTMRWRYGKALKLKPNHVGAEYLGELVPEMKDLPKAEERLAVLTKACNGCEEQKELEERSRRLQGEQRVGTVCVAPSRNPACWRSSSRRSPCGSEPNLFRDQESDRQIAAGSPVMQAGAHHPFHQLGDWNPIGSY
jgi:hypothetical protein